MQLGAESADADAGERRAQALEAEGDGDLEGVEDADQLGRQRDFVDAAQLGNDLMWGWGEAAREGEEGAREECEGEGEGEGEGIRRGSRTW